MPEQVSNVEKVQRLRWGLAGDFANVFHYYLTFSPTILLLFLDKLKLTKPQIGLVLGLITFVDLVSLVSSPIAARKGYKKVFLSFWAGRKFAILAMIAAPLVLAWSNPDTTFVFVFGVMLVFSLCRSIAVSALTPWSQEYVPAQVRGKFSAWQTVVTVLAVNIAALSASWYLGDKPEAPRFIPLFLVAFAIGLLSLVGYSRLPGGEPEPAARRPTGVLDDMAVAVRDKRFIRFEVGSQVITIGWGLMSAFLTLFYREQARIPAEKLFILDSVQVAAGLASCFLWGWASDRFGSKPVMLLNLSGHVVLPIVLLLLPLDNPGLAFWIVLAAVVFLGLVGPGWNIGYNRYFFVNLVPASNRTGYMSLHAAIAGVVAGLTPLITGQLLEITKNLSGHWWLVNVNPYTPMFVAAAVAVIATVVILSGLPSSGAMGVSSFAAMFFQGNPILAMQALIAHGMGGHERARIATIERLGQARSPLSVDELLEGLRDPAFNVRYEAVNAIARTTPHPRLTQALITLVEENREPELALAAAWGLGRIGDPLAIPALRGAMRSEFPLLRSRAARALGMLRDGASAPELVKMFREEPDTTIRLAYASALAQLHHDAALPALLEFLHSQTAEHVRLEAALAIATILGQDERAVMLWRRMYADPADALAGVALGLRRRLRTLVPDLPAGNETLNHVIDRCARAFSAKEMPRGVAELRVLAAAVSPDTLKPSAALVLRASIAAIDEFSDKRLEYVTLCVHSLHVGVRNA